MKSTIVLVIIDFLLYLRFCAERPKHTRKEHDIPGPSIGAVRGKNLSNFLFSKTQTNFVRKLYFGALPIRKEEEVVDLNSCETAACHIFTCGSK